MKRLCWISLFTQLVAGGSVLKKTLKKKRKGSQGNITFEKILNSTGAPANGSRANLVCC